METKETGLKHYEMLYIIPVKYTVDELPAINQKVKDLMAEYHCQITREEDLGKKKLTYPIGQVYHGYYFVVEFNMEPSELQKLNNSLRLSADISRHMIIATKEKTAAEVEAEKVRRSREEAAEVAQLKEKIEAQAPSSVVEKPEAEKEVPKGKVKVSIEDLDKKLDELIDSSLL